MSDYEHSKNTFTRKHGLKYINISYLENKGVQAVFHYLSLHSSEAGKQFGRFVGEDRYTTVESERLLRLPFHLDLTSEDIDYVCDCIEEFFTR